MCGPSADGGGEAAGTGAPGGELVGGVEADLGAEEGGWGRGEGVEGALQGVGHYCGEGGAVYGCAIPTVGGAEGVEAADDGAGGDLRVGERVGWVCEWGCGGGGDDAVGCVEDEVDACEGEGGCGGYVEANFEG